MTNHKPLLLLRLQDVPTCNDHLVCHSKKVIATGDIRKSGRLLRHFHLLAHLDLGFGARLSAAS